MLLPEVKKHYGKLKFLIDGEWVDSKSTSVELDTNPATDEVIAEFPMATKEEAFKAVDAAQRAFQTWRNVSIRDRAYMLFTMHHKFRDNLRDALPCPDPGSRPDDRRSQRICRSSSGEHRIRL